MSNCFRVRFRLGDTARIHSDATELSLPTPSGSPEDVTIRPCDSGVMIRDAPELLLIGKGYASEAEARKAGIRWREVTQRTFGSCWIGADFGDREPTEDGRTHVVERGGKRWIDDSSFGVQVFECEPWPGFERALPLGYRTAPSEERFIEAISTAAEHDVTMSERERLACALFAASFSENSADARFMTLMMAVETLLDQPLRPRPVVQHIDALIEQTRDADLPPDEIESLVGGLVRLREESIGRAGKKLARTLPRRFYMSESPAAFFSKCYEIRSDLAHGAVPRPPLTEVASRAEQLRHFVGDLLSVELLETRSDPG
jgi:hypothetical protein